MNGLRGGQGREAHELVDTAQGMGLVLLWVGAAVVVAWLVSEVL